MADNTNKIRKSTPEKEHKAIVDTKKKNLKKTAKFVVIALVILLAVYGILYVVDMAFTGDSKNSANESKTDSGASSAVSDENGELSNKGMEFSNISITTDYYEPDYDTDIFSDAQYMATDRSVRYYASGNGSFTEGYVLNEEGVAVHNLKPGQRFFLKYFDAITKGDYETYHELIAEDYAGNPGAYRDNPKNNRFPMQRLYNIKITEMGVFDQGYIYKGENAVVGMYVVEYSIMKNDGEFRLNLPSDSRIPLYYTTITTGAGTEKEKTVLWRVQYKEDLGAVQGDDGQ